MDCAASTGRCVVSPRFGGGSGLKRFDRGCETGQVIGLPSLRRGEWIETLEGLEVEWCSSWGSPLASAGGVD